MDVNVITADWALGANGGYTQSVRNVPATGASIAELINWLNSLGVAYSDFHVMGHSLGAHVAGLACRLSNGTIGQITGITLIIFLLKKKTENWNKRFE